MFAEVISTRNPGNIPSSSCGVPVILEQTVENLEKRVKQCALDLGFDLVGIASAEAFSEHQAVTLERIRDGLMDGLPWFTEARVRRGCDPQALLPGAKSIVTVGMSYHSPGGESRDGPPTGKVARYAWGDDYHRVIKEKLGRLAQRLSEDLGRELAARWYVDDGPMLDRAAAERGGIGWFGKNTNVLTRSHGSWVFLGQLVTDLELDPDPPLKKTCGSCVRCIDACPTGAIVAPYVIDNARCISHLTIENRGPIPRQYRPLMYDWVFGCDICQDVCPVNLKAAYTREQAFRKRRFTSPDLVGLLRMSDEEFRERFRDSPARRAKRSGLRRNACVALGNAGDLGAVPALVEALGDDEPLVRGHAAWALGRLGGDSARHGLEAALGREEDPEVVEEIETALGEARARSVEGC